MTISRLFIKIFSSLFLLIFVFLSLYADTIHTVQRGETLTSISKQYKISVAELKQLNKLKNDNIQAGQRLVVQKVNNKKPIKYTVKAGDNLTSISKRFNTSIKELSEWNNLKSSNININQVLIVSYEGMDTVNKSNSSISRATPKKQEKPKFHIVKKGDTLSDIANKYSMDLLEIIDYNKLTDVNIQPSQRIWLEDGHVTETKSEKLPTNLPSITRKSESGTRVLTHTVKRGENLYRIALNNKVTVDQLIAWNGLSSLNIKAGQVLYLMDISSIKNLEKIVETSRKGIPEISTQSILPVSQIKILSEFGMRSGRLHKGIDFAGSPGDPIYAVLPGKVVFSGIQRGFGNVVIIEHNNFIMTVYGHNESNLVSVGDDITQGHLIATLGSTGNASAPHLHFEYRVRGVARNPKELLKQLP
jgi:murein DD-endopeptidase MepM/ murein hydrolase activator NlpD